MKQHTPATFAPVILLGFWLFMSLVNLFFHSHHETIQVSHVCSGGNSIQIAKVNNLHHPHGIKNKSVNRWNHTAGLETSINLTLPLFDSRVQNQLLSMAPLIGAPLQMNSNESNNAGNGRTSNSTDDRGNDSITHNSDWIVAIIGYVMGSALSGCVIIWWCFKKPNDRTDRSGGHRRFDNSENVK